MAYRAVALKLLPPSLQLEFQSCSLQTGCGEMEADNKSSKIKGSMKEGDRKFSIYKQLLWWILPKFFFSSSQI